MQTVKKKFDIDPEFAKFERPGIAVDIILFTVTKTDLQVGLLRRLEAPHKGKFALPGRFVRYDETIEDTAKTALFEKCSIDPQKVHLEQLYTFGQNLTRDTRIRTISIVYYGLVCHQDISTFSNKEYQWFSVYNLPDVAFDHAEIISYAVSRLRNKIIWDKHSFKLMPPEFTLTELQKTFEIILDEKLDKRNFRKKIAEQNVVLETGKTKIDGVHRPAMLYKVNPQTKKFSFR
jgi:8-oxo-dGTP diphosphatase